MQKKIALVLTALLILTAMLTMPIYVPESAAVTVPAKYKVTLATKNCNAEVFGNLSYNGMPMLPGFCLKVVCGGFVYTKIELPEMPNDIDFIKYVDWDKDGVVEETIRVTQPQIPLPYQHEESIIYNMTIQSNTPVPPNPECTSWHELTPDAMHEYHLQDWEDNGDGILSVCDYVWLNMTYPMGMWCAKQKYHVESVVDMGGILMVQLSQRKIVDLEVEAMVPEPHQWQVTLTSKPNVTAQAVGVLTKNTQPIVGTEFALNTGGHPDPNGKIWIVSDMKCKVVTTAECVIPNDIQFTLQIDWNNDHVWDYVVPVMEWLNQTPVVGPMFPYEYEAPSGPAGQVVTLTVEQVHMQKVAVWAGYTASCVQLGTSPPGWWASPYASRTGEYTPGEIKNNVTYSEKDPITGVVKMGIPSESYKGFNHTYWSPRVGTFFRVGLALEEQGCGYLFTGEGKDPIYPDVDLYTHTNASGTYSFGPDHTKGTADDLLAVPDPCLQRMSGLDGIPGTGDPLDCFGDGTIDTKGSGILLVPLTLYVQVYQGTVIGWTSLFASAWPLVYSTETAHGEIESGQFAGTSKTIKGHPMETLHSGTAWKPCTGCDVWVEYAAVWAILQTPTVLGPLDALYAAKQYTTKYDPTLAALGGFLLGDLDCNYKVDGYDLIGLGGSFGAKDETFGYAIADKNWNVRADLDFNGKVDGYDLIGLGSYFGKTIAKQKTWAFPTAVLVSPAGPYVNGTTYYFNATGSSDPAPGYIEWYLISWVSTLGWQAGQGFCDGSQTPTNLPVNVKVPGTYILTLWVTDDQGLTAKTSKTIVVGLAP